MCSSLRAALTNSVPLLSFMTVKEPDAKKPEVFLYAPERDFNELEDGVKIIKEFLDK